MSTTTPPTAFRPPFDDADADITLRSSDQVDFHVYKVILSKASPFFKDMFSLPQPVGADNTHNSHTVIDLLETSNTVATFLTAIYPILEPKMDGEPSLSDHLAAIEAAKKYDMAVALTFFLNDFECSVCVRDRPVEAFCAAYTLKLGEAAQIAAKASLEHRLSLGDLGDELQHTNGPALFRLWQFHRACSAAAIAAFPGTTLSWVTPAQISWWELVDTKSQGCTRCEKKNCL